MGHVFFFQAEDGIRDADVTGVQTCALPISLCAAGIAVGPGIDLVFAANLVRVALMNPAYARHAGRFAIEVRIGIGGAETQHPAIIAIADSADAWEPARARDGAGKPDALDGVVLQRFRRR